MSLVYKLFFSFLFCANTIYAQTKQGGAATILDMPLNWRKTLKELRLQTWSNDVVIGLMSITFKTLNVKFK